VDEGTANLILNCVTLALSSFQTVALAYIAAKWYGRQSGD
jgi:hypothetical protein